MSSASGKLPVEERHGFELWRPVPRLDRSEDQGDMSVSAGQLERVMVCLHVYSERRYVQRSADISGRRATADWVLLHITRRTFTGARRPQISERWHSIVRK
jgi:hypothetical protein